MPGYHGDLLGLVTTVLKIQTPNSDLSNHGYQKMKKQLVLIYDAVLSSFGRSQITVQKPNGYFMQPGNSLRFLKITGADGSLILIFENTWN
jgi:hypothetical protein